MLPVEVVSVARKPDVFVRALTSEEGRKLAQIGRRSKQPVRMRRAIVVMASGQHQPVALIAKLMHVSEAYVRQVIHDFNEKGMDALDPKWKGGRPAKTDPARREADLSDRSVLSPGFGVAVLDVESVEAGRGVAGQRDR